LGLHEISFRAFTPDDAEFCYKTRARAFIEKFYGELTSGQVAAGVLAYLPSDIVETARESPIFIAEQNGERRAFICLKRYKLHEVKIPWLYVDLRHLGQGIGQLCIEYIERWLLSNWKEVHTLIVDTIIPNYNGAFYNKVGFSAVGKTSCWFSGLNIPALRLQKTLLQTTRVPS